MSEHVEYKGKYLGALRMENTGKVAFVAENLECLAELFKIPQKGKIKLEFRGKIPYEQFLKRISGFYPTMDEWLLKNESGRTVDEFEARRNLA